MMDQDEGIKRAVEHLNEHLSHSME
jgi:hypothetical protein